MAVRVHISQPPDDHEALQALLDPSIRLSTGKEMPDRVDVVVDGRPAADQLAAVRAVIIPWAGVPESTLALLREHPGVSLHNLHHNAPQVAELAVGLLFACAKHILPYDRGLRSGDWSLRYEPARAMLLSGRTAVVLGYGAIGRHAGRILKALGMRVVGVNRSGRSASDPGADRIVPISHLPDVLPIADVLLIALPLTDETRSLIGEAAIQALPKGALIVNIGRGPIIDQHALYAALESRHLGGAGLDVWWNYPADEAARLHTFPADAALHELDNLVMSPHRAGSVVERNAGWSAALAELLNAFARGEEMPNRVDLELGY